MSPIIGLIWEEEGGVEKYKILKSHINIFNNPAKVWARLEFIKKKLTLELLGNCIRVISEFQI